MSRAATFRSRARASPIRQAPAARRSTSATIRRTLNSRFTLADGLVLTVDPSFQYVKANGGGTATAREAPNDLDSTGGFANCTTVTSGAGVNCQPGYYGGNPYAGQDLNGDGDILDQVNILAPSETQTRRYGVIAGLRYDITDTQTVRIGYTFDKGRHHQTGETGFLLPNGFPVDVFPTNNPIVAPNGVRLQKRDRLSYAILNQVSGEYRGEFGPVTLNVGVRAPFYERDLNQHCFTSSASGFVECAGNAAVNAQLAALHPYAVNSINVPVSGAWSPPQSRVYKYNRVLPNLGVTWKATQNVSLFASYAKGLQVPGTDNLYNAFFFRWEARRPPRLRKRPTTSTRASNILRARCRSRSGHGTPGSPTASPAPMTPTPSRRSIATSAASISTASTATSIGRPSPRS